MEEQKSKEVKMTPENGEGKKEGKQLSYEELANAANSLFNENRYLKQQLQQATDTLNTINRLGYLFRVVEIDHNNRSNSVSFASAFVEECIDEIQKIMTLPKEEETEAKEN